MNPSNANTASKEGSEGNIDDVRRELLEYLASDDYSISPRNYLGTISAHGYLNLIDFIADIPASNVTEIIWIKTLTPPAPELGMRYVVRDTPNKKGSLVKITGMQDQDIACLKMDSDLNLMELLQNFKGILFGNNAQLSQMDALTEYCFNELIPEKTYLQTHLTRKQSIADGRINKQRSSDLSPELMLKKDVCTNETPSLENPTAFFGRPASAKNKLKVSGIAELFQKPNQDISEVPFRITADTIFYDPYGDHRQQERPVGKRKGIEGAHKSCYMDSFLFCMFYTTHIFDFTLETKPTDSDFKKKTRKILKHNVVYPLRKNYFCNWESLWELRQHLSVLNEDLLGAFMDAEKFLHILFDQALQQENFIRYGEVGNDGWGDFMHVMSASTDDPSNVITVAENVKKSFHLNGGIQIARVPSPAFILGIQRKGGVSNHYDAVIPNLEINIEHLMKPGICQFCRNRADWESQPHHNGIAPVFICNTCVSSDKPDIMFEDRRIVSRKRMKINAILCVRNAHYVAFVRAFSNKNENGDQWYFFDSMAGGYPEVEIVPEMAKWLNIMSENPMKFNTEYIPSPVKRCFTDAHLCIYEPVVYDNDIVPIPNSKALGSPLTPKVASSSRLSSSKATVKQSLNVDREKLFLKPRTYNRDVLETKLNRERRQPKFPTRLLKEKPIALKEDNLSAETTRREANHTPDILPSNKPSIQNKTVKLDSTKILSLQQKQSDDKSTNLAYAKLPLKILIGDKKPLKIVAYTNWTVGKLKQEIQRLSHQDKASASLILEYGDKLFTDDDRLLGTYEMDPDSIIQAKVQKILDEIPDVANLKLSAKSQSSILLIGNCVALKNGTEPADVQGINPGSLLLAKIDIENLTLGEIKMTCLINELRNTIFVGVKFRKQLALGSSGIRVQHVNVLEGHCDKCKGRKVLFIPGDLVGKSIHHLFQIQ